MGLDVAILLMPVVTKDLSISPRFSPYDFLSRCKFSTLTIRQLMVELYLLTFSRFLLPTPEYNRNPALTRIVLTLPRARLPTKDHSVDVCTVCTVVLLNVS